MTSEKPLKILLVATEAVPFAKEGGVGDVMGSLPGELAALGHEVRVFIPRYGSIDPARWSLASTNIVRTLPMTGADRTFTILRGTLPVSGVPIYFFDQAEYLVEHSFPVAAYDCY